MAESMTCDDQIRFFYVSGKKKKTIILDLESMMVVTRRQPSVTSKSVQQAQMFEVTYSHKCTNMP